MRGSNTLNLNQATIIEAVQEYFDRRYSKDHAFKVDTVRAGTSNNSDGFTVTISERKIYTGGAGGAGSVVVEGRDGGRS